MSKTALILFAHGARDPEWAVPLRRVAEAVRQQMPGLRVELAFLEFMSPDLQNCVASLASEAFDRLVILPMFIAQGGHIKKDLPVILDQLRQRYPQVVFELSCPIGEADRVVNAMAAYAGSLIGE